MSIILEFDSIEHRYGQHIALQPISFQVYAQQFFCLLGPSGCGKTTALRIAAGLEHPCGGRVLLNGKVISDKQHVVTPEIRGIGLLFQDYALFPHLTVEENIRFGLQHLSSFEQQQRVQTWLSRVDLLKHRISYPHMLSGGEQQRIALARALAPQPTLLLLDEPFSNLDTLLRQQIRDEVLAALTELGISALMVTHDPEEALYMGERIALMGQGQIIQQDSNTNLYCNPSNPEVACFFGHVNRFTAQVQQQQVSTPFGSLPAPHLAEGTNALILIRAEALQPCDDFPPQAVVKSVRHLGRISLINLTLLPELGFNTTAQLQINTLGYSTLNAGDKIALRLDNKLAFVFADKN